MSTRSTLALAAFACMLSACARAAGGEAGPELIVAEGMTGNPTAAVAADGAAYIAWIGTTDSVANVYIARVDRDGAPARVNDIPGDAAPHDQAPPQVRVAPDGTVYIVWQNNVHMPGRRFPASNLRLARSTDGGRTFEPAIFVNDDAHDVPASHTFHDIAIADDGTVHVSWIDGRVRAHAELAAGTAPGSAHGHGAHGDASLPGSQVRIARSEDGGRTFGPSSVVHDNVCPCCRTSLAVTADGRIYIAFRGIEDGVRDILVRRSDDGGTTFGPPVRAHADGWAIDGCPHAGPSLLTTADGAVHVAWYTGAPERQGIWYSRSDDGAASFAPPVAVNADGWVPVSQTRLAADSAGLVWIAWDDRREEQHVVRLAAVAAGGVQAHANAAAAGQSPALAAAGTVLLAWQTPNGVRMREITPR